MAPPQYAPPPPQPPRRDTGFLEALQLCVAVACLTIVAATPLYFVCSRLLNKIVTPKTCVIFPLCITILVVVMREII
ncbi:hypothetical protein RHGRI_032451 [Rhododendron griersonianum]|uniref:Uncharacterized protein n=1 Tax=Rhododendron griersonianum TaxID=479676 RepID=A0AAV6IEC3_9ERIC|nr:hypothetical protein RHGRI_032451 [Rhododendron griersonianum]